MQLERQLAACGAALQRHIVQPEHSIKFLTAGRVVRVAEGATEWGWGAVVNFQKKPNPVKVGFFLSIK